MSEAIDIEKLRELATKAGDVAPGAWEHDTDNNDGAYGSGPDARHGFSSYFMMDDKGRRMFDSYNSEIAEVHEEDECAWDENSRRLFDFLAAANPATVLSLLDRLAEAEELSARVLGDPDQGHWWTAVVGDTHTPSGELPTIKHLHPAMVKPIYEAHKGTAVADVIAGLAFHIAITENREQFLVAKANERASEAEAERDQEGLARVRAETALKGARQEITDVLSWALDERTPLRVAEVASLRNRLAAIDAALASERPPIDQEVSQGSGQRGCGEQPEPTSPATAALAPDMLEWLATRYGLELSYTYDDEYEDMFWCVHQVRGGVNDREWDLIGQGPTPLAALLSARSYLEAKDAPAPTQQDEEGGA